MNRVIVVFSSKKNGWLQVQVYLPDYLPNGTLKLVTNLSASTYNEKNNIYHLSETEMKLVKLTHFVTDSNLQKKLPKGLLVDDIYQEIAKPEKDRNGQLRQFYDLLLTYNEKIISLLTNELNADCYFNFSNISSLFEDDRLDVTCNFCEPVYTVNVDADKVNYKIQLSYEDKFLDIQYKSRFFHFFPTPSITIITEKRLYRFKQLNYRQIEPFLRQDTFLSFPTQFLSKPDNFLSRLVRDYKIIPSGFSVEEITQMPIPRLSLKEDFNCKPCLVLDFNYSGRYVAFNASEKVLVTNQLQKNGSYLFTKTTRQLEKERESFSLLAANGLKQIENVFDLKELQLTITKVEVELSSGAGVEYFVGWINDHYDILKSFDFELDIKLEGATYYVGNSTLEGDLHAQNDWFDLNAVVKIGEYVIPFARFKSHILNHTLEYVLPNNQIFIIPSEWFVKYSDLFYYSDVKSDVISLRRGLTHLIATGFDSKRIGFDLALLKKFDNDSFVTPMGLKTELRPYQKDGCQWMQNLQSNMFGGILADDMGLGKTIQVISLLVSVFNNSNSKQVEVNKSEDLSLPFDDMPEASITFNQTEIPPCLIVVPTSLVFNWMLEIKKFAPHLAVFHFNDKCKLEKETLFTLNRYHVVIISYGLMQNRIDALCDYNFQYIVLDESQFIKNPTSKRYLAVNRLKSNYRLAISGTPIENSLSDLWAQMNFVNPGLLKSLKHFKDRYINPIEKQVERNSEEEAERLFRIIDPFILRRTKDMVAKQLPPLTIQTIYCSMSSAQQSYYEKARAAVRREYLTEKASVGFSKSTALALKAITRLRQIANHPVLVDDEYVDDSGKYEEVMLSLENIIDEKHNVLVFSQFSRNLAIYQEAAKKNGWDFAVITGATKDRAAEVEKFNSDSNCRIFFITTKAGGTGLNLTKADYVFMLDPWWNESAEYQAFSRAHRMGQEKAVFVYRFISNETIEQKMAHLQSKKSATADRFIRPHEQFGTITEGEMEELLSE